jgi:hypothetical protein
MSPVTIRLEKLLNPRRQSNELQHDKEKTSELLIFHFIVIVVSANSWVYEFKRNFRNHEELAL